MPIEIPRKNEILMHHQTVRDLFNIEAELRSMVVFIEDSKLAFFLVCFIQFQRGNEIEFIQETETFD